MPPSLGVVNASRGREDDAIRVAKRGVETLPRSEDAFPGTEPLANLALTDVRLGEYDKAIDELDHLLSIPSEITTAWLRYQPHRVPLRDHARFQALREEYCALP